VFARSINYEAQAAIELEALVDPQETGSYNFTINEQIGIGQVINGILDAYPLWRQELQ